MAARIRRIAALGRSSAAHLGQNEFAARKSKQIA
jgi:hypothetical protein